VSALDATSDAVEGSADNKLGVGKRIREGEGGDWKVGRVVGIAITCT
jgi:hypothetical protein